MRQGVRTVVEEMWKIDPGKAEGLRREEEEMLSGISESLLDDLED